MTQEEIKARIAELDKEIAEYPYWGAALAAMDEERRALRRMLGRKEQVMTKREALKRCEAAETVCEMLCEAVDVTWDQIPDAYRVPLVLAVDKATTAEAL